MFLRLNGNGFKNGSVSNESSDGGESKIESGVKEECVYRKNKELL